MSYKVFGIRAARLFDGHTVHEGPVLILIDSGQIQDVDLTGALPPEGAELIDLGDTTLLPGLVDSHTHLVWDPSGNPENLATDSNADLLLRARKHATAALHSGITTVRDLGDRDFATLQLRNEYQAGQGIGPELLVAGPPITRTGGHCWYLGCKVDTIDALIAAVQERADRGVDWVKVMATGGFRTQGSDPFVPQYTVEQLTTLVHAAHEHGMPIAAHAHATSGIAAAVAAGVDGIEHCTFVSEQGAVLDQATVEAMAARGIWAGITIAQPRDDLSSTTLAILEKKWGNVRTLMHSGVHVVFSTDAGIYSTKPHDVLAKELIYVASQGFTNLEVLTAATSIAADSCHVGHRKGRIAPHYDADVIAIPGNPLRNINELLNIQAVFRAGHRVR